jgi:hypothetical protein
MKNVSLKEESLALLPNDLNFEELMGVKGGSEPDEVICTDDAKGLTVSCQEHAI